PAGAGRRGRVTSGNRLPRTEQAVIRLVALQRRPSLKRERRIQATFAYASGSDKKSLKRERRIQATFAYASGSDKKSPSRGYFLTFEQISLSVSRANSLPSARATAARTVFGSKAARAFSR